MSLFWDDTKARELLKCFPFLEGWLTINVLFAAVGLMLVAGRIFSPKMSHAPIFIDGEVVGISQGLWFIYLWVLQRKMK